MADPQPGDRATVERISGKTYVRINGELYWSCRGASRRARYEVIEVRRLHILLRDPATPWATIRVGRKDVAELRDEEA